MIVACTARASASSGVAIPVFTRACELEWLTTPNSCGSRWAWPPGDAPFSLTHSRTHTQPDNPTAGHTHARPAGIFWMMTPSPFPSSPPHRAKKELGSYQVEAAKQEEKIAAMEASGADAYDVKKQV